MAHDRILIVSHAYAPQQNPRALRWGSIARYWGSQGVAVDIVTASQPGLPSRLTLDGVTVYRVGNRPVEKVRALFSTRNALLKADSGPNPRRLPFLKSSLKLLHDVTWRHLYWPDYACLWIAPASRQIQSLLSRNDYSTVISVSDPYSGHLATYRALKQSSPIRWLVDIGDPFSSRELATPNNQHLYLARNRRLENDILSHSSVVTVTTEATSAEYARIFPHVAEKLHVIGPVMSQSEDVSRNHDRRPTVRSGKKLVFVGTLYAELRHPGSLLRLFAELIKRPGLGNTELHFYGGTVGSSNFLDGFQSLLNTNLFLHGVQPRERVLQAMDDADILVNIGNHSTVQLPSKVVEYVWAGKPIWNLSSVPNDCSSSYLKGYPHLLSQTCLDSSQPEQSVEELARFVTSVPFKISENDLKEWRDRSRVSSIAGQYAGLCCLNPQSQGYQEAARKSGLNHEVTLSQGQMRYETTIAIQS